MALNTLGKCIINLSKYLCAEFEFYLQNGWTFSGTACKHGKAPDLCLRAGTIATMESQFGALLCWTHVFPELCEITAHRSSGSHKVCIRRRVLDVLHHETFIQESVVCVKCPTLDGVDWKGLVFKTTWLGQGKNCTLFWCAVSCGQGRLPSVIRVAEQNLPANRHYCKECVSFIIDFVIFMLIKVP